MFPAQVTPIFLDPSLSESIRATAYVSPTSILASGAGQLTIHLVGYTGPMWPSPSLWPIGICSCGLYAGISRMMLCGSGGSGGSILSSFVACDGVLGLVDDVTHDYAVYVECRVECVCS